MAFAVLMSFLDPLHVLFLGCLFLDLCPLDDIFVYIQTSEMVCLGFWYVREICCVFESCCVFEFLLCLNSCCVRANMLCV